MRILLVEDSDFDAKLICTNLETDDENFERVTTLRQAMERLSHCDLILLDLNLPDSESLETLKSIREGTSSSIGHPIVIVLTESDSPTLAQDAARYGAHGIVRKECMVEKCAREVINDAYHFALGARKKRLEQKSQMLRQWNSDKKSAYA